MEGDHRRVNERVYRLRGAPLIWQRTAMEGLLMAGPGSMLSHRTAAWLHKLDGFNEPTVFDVALNARIDPRYRGYRFHQSARGFGTPVTASLFPITSVQRTIVDLAGELESEALELALDSAQRRYKGFGDWLQTCVAGLNPQGTPGLTELKMLLELRGNCVTDSALEVKVLRALRKAGLKPSETPVIVMDGDEYVIRLDFAWPDLKVALHVDGYRWHHQRERFDRDARQRSWLQKLGWQCITVTATTFREGAWLEQLRALLNPQGELAL
jgi:very-short-patch-repair endonuclease